VLPILDEKPLPGYRLNRRLTGTSEARVRTERRHDLAKGGDKCIADDSMRKSLSQEHQRPCEEG
jgi:hypothetical protein